MAQQAKLTKFPNGKIRPDLVATDEGVYYVYQTADRLLMLQSFDAGFSNFRGKLCFTPLGYFALSLDFVGRLFVGLCSYDGDREKPQTV